MNVNSVRISSTAPQRRKVEPQQPDKLFYCDIDDTYLAQGEPDLEARRLTNETLAQHPEMVVGLSTLRRLQDVQGLVEQLSKLPPMSFLGVSNAQELYVNHHNLPTAQWLLSLTPADQDAEWSNEVKSRMGGWQAGEKVPATLRELGFEEFPAIKEGDPRRFFRRGEAEVSLFEGNAAFVLKKGTPKLGREIAEAIQQSLSECSVSSHDVLHRFKDGNETHNIVSESVSKVGLLEHCLKKYPGVKFVVTAGDAITDDQLYPDEVDGRPNYRIVAGSREDLAQRMQGVHRVVKVASGDLGPGLRQHLSAMA